MTVTAPTPADRAQLEAAVKTALARLPLSPDPDHALAHAARAHGLTPGRIALAAAALNGGLQLAQQQAGEGAEKFAAFAPADPDRVRALLAAAPAAPAPAPVTKVAADRAGWEAPPRAVAVKAASAVPAVAPPPAHPAPADAAVYRHRADRQARELAVKSAAAERRLAHADAHAACERAAAYFRLSPTGRDPAGAVAKTARAYLGEAAGQFVARAAAAAGCRAEPAHAGVPLDHPVLRAFGAVKAAVERQVKAERELATKTASGPLSWPALGTLVGITGAQTLAPSPPGERPEVRAMLDKLNSPDHHDELRRIRVRAMLHKLMTDPNDMLSGQPPEAVVDAFNEMARLAPRTAEQPALVGPYLRRALSGRQEAFEAKTLLDADRALAGPSPALKLQ